MAGLIMSIAGGNVSQNKKMNVTSFEILEVSLCIQRVGKSTNLGIF